MDELDIAILRGLFGDINHYPARSQIRESLSSLSRKLRVSEPSLRKRVNAFFNSGFLQGWSVYVNPHVIHQYVAQVRLDRLPPSSKDDAIREIELLDDIWFISKHFGDALTVGLYYADELSLRKRVELLGRITGAQRVDHGRIPYPPCRYSFTRYDLAILKALLDVPSLPYALIAQQTHLSSRTVRRRLDRMIREHALFVAPRVDMRALKGVIPAQLLVFYSDSEAGRDTDATITSLVQSRTLAPVHGTSHSWFPMMLWNLAEAEQIRNRVMDLEGVRAAYVDPLEEHLLQYETFKNQIDRLSLWGEGERSSDGQ